MTDQALSDPDRAWLATLSVLYVEDDAETRAHFTRFLGRRVGRVVEAADGVEGLERFRAERPALVVTDIQMPRMDGLAMVEEIRTIAPGTPVIVTTAFEQIDYLQRSIDARVDKYVTKPVLTDRLEEALLSCAHGLRAEARLVRERQDEVDRLRTHEHEARRLLAAGMAHDFNNLIQTIFLAFESVLPLAAPGSESRETVDDGLQAVLQARTLGQHLQTLSESGFAAHAPMRIEPTLQGAIADALSGSRTSLRLGLPEGLPMVVHNRDLLGRAFAHLARNAREAMSDAGVLSVEATTRVLAEGEAPPLPAGPCVQVTFRDTGPGIAPDVLPRVFDPYFSTKPRGCVRGMGLGLSLCLAILRRHGGLVSASSTPGEGAVLTVLLPAVEPHPPSS